MNILEFKREVNQMQKAISAVSKNVDIEFHTKI